MTLKTFHFAGISSMNITQGVPRVNEIINCTKNIATPIITINLDLSEEKEKSSAKKSLETERKLFATDVKNRIENLTLGRILHSVE